MRAIFQCLQAAVTMVGVHHSAITGGSLIQYRQVIRSSEHNKAEAIVKQLVTQVAKILD